LDVASRPEAVANSAVLTELMTRVLVVNAGSSSVKLSLLGEHDETLAQRELPAPSAAVDEQELKDALEQGLGDADAVGHRIVHGGERFRDAVQVTADVEAALRDLTDLAPLHQPKSLAALDAVSAALPQLPAVACLDTAFHATLPAAAATYALPAKWREGLGVHRYGFHGLSHAWVARRVPELVEGAPAVLRIVSCHLGAGASLCAIRNGRSVDTTMGFTPLDGLVMATRSGSVDPGLVLWLLERTELSQLAMAHALEHESGLLALAGTSDMREVLARAAVGDDHAELGLDVYLHHLRAGIAAMTASLGGLDVLAFTGGVGEHAAEVRALTVDGLAFLGLAIDAAINANPTGDADISVSGAGATTVVVRAREDLEIARQVRRVLAQHGPGQQSAPQIAS
jgi:acetate kinase